VPEADVKTLTKAVTVGRHLIKDPGICHDKLTFKGTRVPVETVLSRLGKGRSIEEILKSWPELTRTAIARALLARIAAGARDSATWD